MNPTDRNEMRRRREIGCASYRSANQRCVEPVTSAALAGGAARRLRNCASSASSAQNSEQKCCPAEVRQTSARLVGGRRNLRQVLSRLGLVGSPRLRER